MKKYISAIVFWGALWGLEEATLGHLLHIAALNIGWFLWFPLAYFFMGMVYKQTGRLSSILLTSVVAAAIKFVNIFMTTNLLIIICPALSILMEGTSLFAILKLLERKKHLLRYPLPKSAAISILWRVLYTVGILAIPASIMPAYPYKSMGMLLKFIIFEGIVNSLFACTIVVIAKRISKISKRNNTYLKQLTEKIITSKAINSLCFKPTVSMCILAVTLITQWVL